MDNLRQEIEKRRTFAIISHPDAGKTTLTEKFLLYGGAINQAGSVKGKATAKHAVSDWMEIEKERGISVTSSVLQFNYEGYCINIRHPLGSADIVKTASSKSVPEHARLKSETFELYPGIELSFHCWLADHFHIRHCHGVSVLSIDHCRVGRIGWEMKGGLSLYFGNGDLSFHYTDKCSDSKDHASARIL